MNIRVLAMSAIALVLVGCKNESEELNKDLIKTTCLNDVVYYHYAENKGEGYKGYGYMAPMWNPDGTLETCKTNQWEVEGVQ